jgi:hypothetical protein
VVGCYAGLRGKIKKEKGVLVMECTLNGNQGEIQHISENDLEDGLASKVTGGANAVDYAMHATAGALLGGMGGTIMGAAVGGAAGKRDGVIKGVEIGAPVGAVVGAAGLAAAAKKFR